MLKIDFTIQLRGRNKEKRIAHKTEENVIISLERVSKHIKNFQEIQRKKSNK